MKILVTGCNGFVGTLLVEQLLQKSHDVVGIDRMASQRGGIEFYECDLSYKITVPRQAFDVVIHCAAAKGDWNLSDEDFQRDNVIATKNLVKYLEDCHIGQIIHFSTVAIYSREVGSGDETTPLTPDSVYGKTKLDSEKLIRAFAAKKAIDTTILRPSVIYGRENFANMYNLIRQLNRALPFQINPKSIVKSHVSVRNVVDVVCRFLESQNQQDLIQIFNLTEKPYMNLGQMIQIICDELGVKQPTISLPVWFVAIPFALFGFLGKIVGRDIGFTRERLQKFSSSTNYTSEKLWSTLGAQKYESEQELRDMVQWFKTTRR